MVRRLRKKRRGLATIEMALVVLMLLLVTLGSIRYGGLFLRAQQITNAARQGARLAALPGVTDAQVYAAIEGLMAAAGMAQASSGYTPQITLGDLSGAGLEEETVTVTIAVPVENLHLLQVPLFTRIEPANGDWDIRARVTMAKEGT